MATRFKIATQDRVETLTNKTLTGVVFSDKIVAKVVVLTNAASVTTDASFGNTFTLTTTQNFTMANPTNSTDGQKIMYKIKQDGTGSRVITWGTNFRGSTDVSLPVLTTTANAVDYVMFIYDSSVTKWNALAVSKGYAS